MRIKKNELPPYIFAMADMTYQKGVPTDVFRLPIVLLT
jgi:hypothetical protein